MAEFERTCDDTVALEETPSVSAWYVRAYAEDVSAVDSRAPTATFGRAGGDTVATVDSQANVFAFDRSGADTVAVVESPNRTATFGRSAVDTPSSADELAREHAAHRTSGDTVDVAEYLGEIPILNFSYEIAGASQGSAANWATTLRSEAEGAGIFNDATTTWDHGESFEKSWRLPSFVHMATASTPQLVTAPDATNEASAITLVGDIGDTYLDHLQDLTRHTALDTWNIRYYTTPASSTQAIAIANDLKTAMLDEDNPGIGHLAACPTASFFVPRAHRKEDIINAVTANDAIDVATLITLANDIKAKLNAHIVLDEYGPYNDAAKFSFTAGTLEAGNFHGLAYETFERTWSIPALQVSAKIAAQSNMVSVDSGNPSWPIGHEQLVTVLDLVPIEFGRPATFEDGWSLPGSGAPGNGTFYRRFYDKVSSVWRIPTLLQQLGILDNFETSWKDCDVGKADHWSGTEWRFLPQQLELGILETFTCWPLTLD